MPEHKGKTDQLSQIELPSVINHVLWGSSQAPAGSKVGLNVFTHYVGNGSDLEIEFKDNAGKSHGKFKDKIQGNHFWASIKVPENARDALYATVKLPKHGLEKKSGPLIVLPPMQITNAKLDKQEARRGDTLKLAGDIMSYNF